MNDLTVVIPIFKELPEVVTKIYDEVKALGCEVIVVNDGDTVKLPDHVRQEYYYPNMGYGFALKQGIYKAKTEYVLTMDGDGQHCAEDVTKIYTVMKMLPNCSMVVGSRYNLIEKPLRWIGRKCLNFFASVICGHYLVDLNSGMRIMRRKLVLDYMNILCDVFSFTTSLTISTVADGHQVVYIPIEVKDRPHGKSHVKVVKHGLITVYYIVRNGLAMRTRGLRKWTRSIVGR